MSALSFERSQSTSVTIDWLSLDKNSLAKIRRRFRFPQQTIVINAHPQIYRYTYTLGSQHPEAREIELFTHPLLWRVEKPFHKARRILAGEPLKIPYPMEAEQQQRSITAIYEQHADEISGFQGNEERIRKYAEQATRSFDTLRLKKPLTPVEARERAERYLTRLGARALERITGQVLAHEYSHTKQSRTKATIDVASQEVAKILAVSIIPEITLLLAALVISIPLHPLVTAGAISISTYYALSKLIKMKKTWKTTMLTKIRVHEEKYAFKQAKRVGHSFQEAVRVDEGRLRQMLFHEPPLQGAKTNKYTLFR